jgi:hypothetical protein
MQGGIMLKRAASLAFAIAVLAMLAAPRVGADPVISVGPYTPSTTMPFVVPIEITGAVDLIFWQFDVAYDATDVQIVTNCDPFSDPFCNFGGTGVTEGPFFGSLSPFNVFNPGFILLDSVTLAQLGQLIAVNDTFGGPLPGPSGDGVVAYIEFVTTATGTGTSPITVQNPSTTSAVPEPATLALLIGGLVLLGARRVTRRN